MLTRFAWFLTVGILGLALTGPLAADDKKGDEKKEEKKKETEEGRKGTVTGIVTAKGPNWIEVKADGEEKARRYVPHWKGGAPKDGGGPDKEMVAKIKETPVKSRVRLEWAFEERPRVVKLEILKKAEEKTGEKKNGEKK